MANEFDYFPLYFRRLLIDTDDMTTLEFGAYMRLLLKAWDEKIPGTLPNIPSDLARKARVDDAVWEQVSPTVLSRFKNLDRPHISQKKMRQVYADLRRLKKTKSSQASAAAKSMWDRKKHADALREHSGGNANETETKIKNSPPKPPQAGAGEGEKNLIQKSRKRSEKPSARDLVLGELAKKRSENGSEPG